MNTQIRSILFFFFLIVATTAVGQVSIDRAAESRRLKKVISENHFHPLPADDQFSQHVFDHVLFQLDPDKLYFTSKDIEQLATFKSLIDDEWNTGTIEYLDKLTVVFRTALERAKANLTQINLLKTDWKTPGELNRGALLQFCTSESALKERWGLWIKYKMLMQMDALLEKDSLQSKPDLKFILTHEQAERKRAVEQEQRSIHQVLEFSGGFENKIAGIYLKAIAATFDPHTVYLSPSEIENFMSALSSQEYSFGLGLKEDNHGDVSIERLVPGGPAWKSGALHQHDVLTRLKTGNDPAVELSGIGLEALSELLDNNNHMVMDLTVKRTDGVMQTVSLRKEKIDEENSIVKGFVLSGKRKVGYISLPGFYSDWGSQEGSSCANDMAREILKLKKENIEGLILDIRSNGGGSVPEAIELAGIFIEEGPLSVFKDRAGKVTTLKDVNRGTVYDGPLVLLVDGRSASASEMLAAALQDYNRAIIIGSATFGKATSQRIFPLNTGDQIAKTGKNDVPTAGFATVTVDKIYRVTGKSVQGPGVQPDITLPDIYDNIIPHESGLPAALPKDSVSMKVPFKYLTALPLKSLQAKSQARVSLNSWFQYISNTNKTLVTLVKDETKPVSLNWNSFLEARHVFDISDNGSHAVVITKISAPLFDKAQADRMPFVAENNDMWIRNLGRDEYVTEAFQVICDYLQIR